MRLFALFWAVLWLAVLGSAGNAAASNIRPIARPDASAPQGGYQLIYSKDYSHPGEMAFMQNGPAEETMINGAGSLQDATVYGRSTCIGQAGQGANFWVNRGLCNPGGSYPANGQFSQANGAFTITMEPTPASIASSLPLTYQDFSATCSATANVMTCAAPGSGTIVAWATIQGTGVSAGCQITGYGTGTGGAGTYPVSCTSFSSTTVTTTRAYAFVSGWVSTRQSFGFKPDKGFCYEVVVQHSTVGATWSAWWTQSNQAAQLYDYTTGAYGTVAQAEVDMPEHFNAAGSTDLSTNFHWNSTVGGAYNSTNTATTTPTKHEGSYHTYRACGDLRTITYWYDGTQIATAPVSATSPGWGGQFQYLINTFDAGNSTAAFEGVYAGGTSTVSTKSVKVWMRGDPIKGTDYFIRETGDGKGRELMFQSLLNPRAPTGTYCTCGVSVASATTVDGIPGQPILITDTSNNVDDAQLYKTDSGFGVQSGHTYTVTVKYNYGTSNALRLFMGRNGSSDIVLRFAGTTVTDWVSSCPSSSITTVGSHKEFTCQWTAAGTGNLFIGAGPDSGVSGQTATVYSISVQDNAPNS